MRRTLSQSWLLSLLWLLLWVGSAQSDFCHKNLPPSNPDIVYIDHGDGTVTDTRTGLMWKQCTEGLSGAGCETGSAQTFMWGQALTEAKSSTFANYSDWRLPNIKELASLIEDCRGGPAINTNKFPNTPSSRHWSGSPTTHSSSLAHNVDFLPGRWSFGDRRNLVSAVGHVRLVRDGQ